MQALSTWMCDVDMSLSKSSCIAYRLSDNLPLLEATIVALGVAEADEHLRAHSNAWHKGYKHNA